MSSLKKRAIDVAWVDIKAREARQKASQGNLPACAFYGLVGDHAHGLLEGLSPYWSGSPRRQTHALG